MKKLYFPVLILSVLILSCSDDSVQNTGSNNNYIPTGDIFIIKRSPQQGGYSTFSINEDGTNLKLINDSLMISSSSYSGKISLAKIDNSGYFFDKLYVADTNGNNIVNIPRENYYPVCFILSPKGDKVLFTTDVENSLCVINSYGTGLKLISNGIRGTERVPKFSPDGLRIAFFEAPANLHTALYIINTDGFGKVLVKDSILYQQAAMLDWSPDGSKLVFENGNAPNTKICIIDTNGSKYTVLTDGVNPSWSRDGSKIAFLKNVNQGLQDVFIIDTDGSNIQNISNTFNELETEPYCSPVNFNKILFVTSPMPYGILKSYDVNSQDISVIADSVTWAFWKY